MLRLRIIIVGDISQRQFYGQRSRPSVFLGARFYETSEIQFSDSSASGPD